jgi:hypothetical protein
MAEVTSQEIQAAANQVGLMISADEAQKLSKGERIELKPAAVRAAAGQKCEGIKLIPIGTKCGLYLILGNPIRLSFCCEF